MNQNPYDSLANSILKSISAGNISSDWNELAEQLGVRHEDDLHRLQSGNRFPAQASRNRKPSSNPCFLKLEQELNTIIGEFEYAKDKTSLSTFQEQILAWEKKVQSAQLKGDEKDYLMANGSLARNFTDLLF